MQKEATMNSRKKEVAELKKRGRKMPEKNTYKGGCLCGYITYQVYGEAISPHLCSCRMCQKWSGALTVAWVGFPKEDLVWNGEGGGPTLYRSSSSTQRGFCPQCGSTLCALDEGSTTIALTLGCLQEPTLILPGPTHSYQEEAPTWWSVKIKREGKEEK